MDEGMGVVYLEWGVWADASSQWCRNPSYISSSSSSLTTLPTPLRSPSPCSPDTHPIPSPNHPHTLSPPSSLLHPHPSPILPFPAPLPPSPLLPSSHYLTSSPTLLSHTTHPTQTLKHSSHTPTLDPTPGTTPGTGHTPAGTPDPITDGTPYMQYGEYPAGHHGTSADPAAFLAALSALFASFLI